MNDSTYDLVVIGGGLAGSSLATVMARSGSRVLVLERDQVFRDRVRGEFLAPWAVDDLRELGLLDVVMDAGAIELPALAGRSLRPRPVAPGGDAALSYSHVEVQEALLSAAAEAGAEVIRGARVTEVAPGRVSFTTPDGEGTAEGRLVVGAEGRSSPTRRALGREVIVRSSERVLAGVRLAGVKADPSVGYFIIREDEGGLAALFPQAGGMARAYVFLASNDASAYRGPGGYERFMESLVNLGVPREVVAEAQPAGPLAAFVADDSWVVGPGADGLALIGDAAGISDPTWGQGMALLFHDVLTLSRELTSDDDWNAAVRRYAEKRDEYFHTIITIEGWLSELQLRPGDEAAARRDHVMAAWKADPRRAAAMDLNGLGPKLDVSEETRRYIFAEDEAPAAASSEASPRVTEDERRPVADAFLGALEDRDYGTLRGLFTETARMRALLPRGPVEVHGGAAVAEQFAAWFGHAAGFSTLDTGAGAVADRVHMHWRFRVRWEGETAETVVEQQAYAKIIDGQVGVLDLVCSGFRPADGAAA